jgi:surfeit locus 1 family protein
VLGAALATGAAFIILVSLGVWQIHRLHWKEGLLAQIDAAEKAPPIPLTGVTPPLFARVIAKGTLVAPPYALYGAEVRDGRLGAQLIEKLERPGQAPLLVVLGWVSTDHATPQPRTGPAEVTGYVRLPEHPNWLSAADDVEGRRFYTLNPATIGPALGAPDAAPFTLVALGPAPAAEALPRPVNNHLNYALTWFGLAAALLAVFVAWVRRRT